MLGYFNGFRSVPRKPPSTLLMYPIVSHRYPQGQQVIVTSTLFEVTKDRSILLYMRSKYAHNACQEECHISVHMYVFTHSLSGLVAYTESANSNEGDKPAVRLRSQLIEEQTRLASHQTESDVIETAPYPR